MKKWISIVAVLVLLAGCGVHAELEQPDGTTIYYNRGWLSPENVTISVNPDGTFEITIGEQPTQAAFIEKVFQAGMILGGAPTVE